MSQPKPLTLPPALKPGDGISIVAPASPPKQRQFDSGFAALAAIGYRPKTYRDFCCRETYLAGTDAERIEELETAFRDPETTMVLAVRGGYGCGRIVDRVDFRLLAQRPKIVCGYSDLTALHAAIQLRAGLVSFHGPNLVSGLGDTDPDTADERAATWSLLQGGFAVGDTLASRSDGYERFASGVAEGPLVGGNLAVLGSLLGTPDAPDFRGAILVLEDTGESAYRIDRLLTQLRQTGALGQLGGIVLGYFSKTDGHEKAEAVLRSELQSLGIPVLASMPVGHEHPNYPLPLGARVRLDADRGSLELAQTVVSD